MILLGLGSNKGDRLENLRKAVSALGNVVRNIVCSPIYESNAMLPPDAPREWDSKFLNMALRCEADITPQQLLTSVKTLEGNLGRTRSGYWGPREIDIDILAFGDMVVNEKHLIIPHKYLLMRDFALIPFADIAPDWAYPVAGEFLGMKAKDLAANLALGLTKTEFEI